jgi:AAA domain-containing protein
MATNIFAEILQWSAFQPLWQRDALRRLFTVGTLTSPDLDALTEICKSVHGLAPSSKKAVPLSAQHLPAGGPAAATAVFLVDLTHHIGVNALAPEQTVSFGPNLTIVYGETATGKSGYTRILKRACRSRFVEDVLGNVLGTNAPLKAKVTIRINEGGTETAIPWSPDAAPSPGLAQISVFDRHCVPVYLRDKTDVAFRPFGLDLFDKLASACAEVKKRLDAAVQHLATSLLPPLPGIMPGTKARQMLDSLTALTKEQDVRALAILSAAEEQRFKHLTELKRDLLASDPKKRAQELSAQAGRYMLVTHLETLAAAFGLEAMSKLGKARDNLRASRLAVETLRKTALTPDLLPGTGGQAWRRMWEAAEGFVKASTPTATFPVGQDARCPFCQQDIKPDAESRLKHLLEFVTSTVQGDVRAAELQYQQLWQAANAVSIERPEMKAVADEVAADDGILESKLAQFFKTAAGTKANVDALTEGDEEPLQVSTFEPKLNDAVKALADGLRARAAQLLASATSLSSAEQSELNSLASRKELAANLDAVLAEIDRKRRIAAYSQCTADTNTLAATKKGTELTKQLITDQLRQTFQAELRNIGFNHLSVEIQAAGGSKGALFHIAPGVRVTDVLSEGESRALSLASFLTELSTAPTRSGIIFDDPVSSLDHHWRERIGKRLAAEAKARQVIVFTHDLVFLRVLVNECDQESVPYTHQYIRRDTQAGICSADLPWLAMNIKQRLGVLRNRWQAANKLYTKSDDPDDYERAGRELYGLLRESWERGVSEVLLNDVVERYRPSIETKKVAPLHDITEADCKAVEAGMTESSRWIRGHDGAIADGSPFPKSDELKGRIDEFEAWIDGIRKRRKK